MSADQYVSDFNSLFIELAHQLKLICPDSTIAEYYHVIPRLLANKPNLIIDIFSEYVIQFKDQINSGDDAFFMGETFSGNLKNMTSNGDVFSKFFEFKNIWNKLDAKNRETVKLYMKFFCDLTEEYKKKI